MATIDELKILVTAEVSKAISELDKTEKQSNKTSSSFAKLRDTMLGPVAAGKEVIRIFQQVKAVSDKMEAAWSSQEEAIAVLNSTLKATGGAAGFTSEEIQAMGSEFQSFTKYGDETVTAMQNVLLGFKNIKGDNFKDASLQILNMATVMNMDLTSAAQAVGKALDDPISGIDSLSRQGFKFSAEQKALLKSLVETGQIAKAQGIILDELATTYGGAAEAAGSTASAIKVKLSNAIGDVNEEIGRSISNSLKPWREKWLELAQAIGASAKAQNDFKEAMARDKEGKATAEDRLVIAERELATLQKLKKETEDLSTAYGGAASSDSTHVAAQIKAQENLIKSIKEQIRLADLYGDQTGKRAIQDQKNAEQAVIDAGKRAAAAKELAESQLANTIAMDAAYEEWGEQILENYGISTLLTPVLEDELDIVKEIVNTVDQVSSAWGDWTIQIGETEIALKDAASGASMVWSSASDAFSAYMDLQQNGSDTLIANLEAQRDRMEENGEDTVAIDQKIRDAKNVAAKKQFDAQKLTSIANIGISTAEGAMKAYSIDPTGILSGIIVALGATQAGMAAAEKYVPFASGGYVDSPTHALVGEAGGEWILNKSQMAGLAKNGIGGGGTTIVQNIGGSIWNTKQLQSMAVSAQAKASRGF